MKTILITGATDGIGLETAKLFAKDGHHLLIHGRNSEKLEKVKEELSKYNGKIQTFCADLSVLENTKRLGKEILAAADTIDIIVNNAGVFVVEDPITKDGLDVRFVVNTISPYILTKMLLPILSNQGRVVNVSSAAQERVDFYAMQTGRMLSHSDAYAQSKLGIVMWGMELAEELGNKAVIISVNPKSFLGSKMVKKAYGRKGYDLSIGANILYRASLSKEFENQTGAYYDNDYEMFAKPHPFALSKQNRMQLIQTMNDIIS